VYPGSYAVRGVVRGGEFFDPAFHFGPFPFVEGTHRSLHIDPVRDDVRSARSFDLADRNDPFGRDLSDKYGFFKKRSQGGMTYQVYGAQMIDLKQELLINDVKNKLRGEEDIKQPESFIQPDD
jgi:hypothetical protein